MLALNAGALSVLAIPIVSWAAKIVHSAASLKTRTASTIDITSITACMAITSRVRSKRSARMPDGIESSSSGPSWAKIRSPTSVADPVLPSTYAGSVKFCIQVPMLDSDIPMNRIRNSG